MNRSMKCTIAVALGLAAAPLLTVACSSAKGDGGTPEEEAQTNKSAGTSTGGAELSGRAEALRVRGLLMADISDTGPLPSAGGELNKVVATADLPALLHADVLKATVTGSGSTSHAEAEIAKVVIGLHAIEADVLKASATAECNGNVPAVRGESSVVSLKINGEAIVVDNTPDQIIDVPGIARVVINEQTRVVDGDHGSIIVNALHATLLNSQEVILSYAEAGVRCGCDSDSDGSGTPGGVIK